MLGAKSYAKNWNKNVERNSGKILLQKTLSQDDFLNKMTSEKGEKRTEPLKYIKESLLC